MLLVELGGGVDVARVGGRGLGDRARLEGAPADRAGRLEAAGVEVGGRARRGGLGAVLGARVAALAVDDHARGEHEPAVEAAGVQRAQQLGRAEVVVGHVLGDVGEVDAEPDHRRLVADGVDAGDGAGGRGGVAEVLAQPFGVVRDIRRDPGVRIGVQMVHDAHRMPAREQLLHDVPDR